MALISPAKSSVLLQTGRNLSDKSRRQNRNMYKLWGNARAFRDDFFMVGHSKAVIRRNLIY